MSITVVNKIEMPMVREQDVIPFRKRIQEFAIKIEMGIVNRTKLITAASELARNMLTHARGGTILIEEVTNKRINTGIRLTFTDSGPGIADLRLAFTDGFSTGTGLGLGLPGAKRLVSEFAIQTLAGEGTTITVIKWKNG